MAPVEEVRVLYFCVCCGNWVSKENLVVMEEKTQTCYLCNIWQRSKDFLLEDNSSSPPRGIRCSDCGDLAFDHKVYCTKENGFLCSTCYMT